MSRRSRRSVWLLLVAGLALAGCSGKDSSSPPVVSGPTFNFTFPATGASHQFTFTDVGDWNYACTPHGSVGMRGVVRVANAFASDSALVQVGAAGAFAYAPDTVLIHPGGHVRWVNVSGTLNHTVTR